MSKHAHKLVYLRSMTWRCMIPGCNYFIHNGLQHILTGRIMTCWSCEKEFIVESLHTVENKLICSECNSSFSREILTELIKGRSTEQ